MPQKQSNRVMDKILHRYTAVSYLGAVMITSSVSAVACAWSKIVLKEYAASSRCLRMMLTVHVYVFALQASQVEQLAVPAL